MTDIIEELKKFRKPLDLQKLKTTHVHYFTPCYGGMLTEGFFRSWSKGNILFTKYGIPYTSIIAVITGTTACTPMMGAKMADIRNPPATPVAPCIAEVTNAPIAITTNKSLEANPNREAIMG